MCKIPRKLPAYSVQDIEAGTSVQCASIQCTRYCGSYQHTVCKIPRKLPAYSVQDIEAGTSIQCASIQCTRYCGSYQHTVCKILKNNDRPFYHLQVCACEVCDILAMHMPDRLQNSGFMLILSNIDQNYIKRQNNTSAQNKPFYTAMLDRHRVVTKLSIAYSIESLFSLNTYGQSTRLIHILNNENQHTNVPKVLPILSITSPYTVEPERAISTFKQVKFFRIYSFSRQTSCLGYFVRLLKKLKFERTISST